MKVRVALPILFTLVLLMMTGFVGYMVSRHSSGLAAAERPILRLYPPDLPPDIVLLRLDKLALEAAYQDQLKKLFSVWVSSQAKDPTMISNGLAIARRAYHEAAAQIAAREQEIQNRR